MPAWAVIVRLGLSLWRGKWTRPRIMKKCTLYVDRIYNETLEEF
jgi:hypothetical protein